VAGTEPWTQRTPRGNSAVILLPMLRESSVDTARVCATVGPAGYASTVLQLARPLPAPPPPLRPALHMPTGVHGTYQRWVRKARARPFIGRLKKACFFRGQNPCPDTIPSLLYSFRHAGRPRAPRRGGPRPRAPRASRGSRCGAARHEARGNRSALWISRAFLRGQRQIPRRR
jgi:hypothetical protein